MHSRSIGGEATHLSVRGDRGFTLLLVVLGIRVLAPADGGFVNLHTWMTVLKSHSTFGGLYLAIFRELLLVGSLNGEWSVSGLLTDALKVCR
jgi:hypothetical protein